MDFSVIFSNFPSYPRTKTRPYIRLPFFFFFCFFFSLTKKNIFLKFQNWWNKILERYSWGVMWRRERAERSNEIIFISHSSKWQREFLNQTNVHESWMTTKSTFNLGKKSQFFFVSFYKNPFSYFRFVQNSIAVTLKTCEFVRYIKQGVCEWWKWVPFPSDFSNQN